MANDLRSFLKGWQETHPEDVLRIKEEINPEFEVSGILAKLEKEDKYPLVILERVRNLKGKLSPYPVVTNLFASRERLASAVGTTPRRVALDFSERESQRLAPVKVSTGRAPVKKVIRKGKQLDLRDFPVLTHHSKDSAPYITGGVVTCKDPDTGVYNLAIQRIEIKDRAKAGIYLYKASHNAFIYRKYERMGKPMPVAVTIGHHPAFGVGSQSTVAYGQSEYDVIGGLMGEPVELTESANWGKDFLIPARAEIVLEGVVKPKVREPEAPFGEFTGYYGPRIDNTVIEFTALNRRSDAYYHDIFVGHPDNVLPGGFAIEAGIYRAVRAVVPGVKNVHLPLSGCCRFYAYVQIRKELEGEGLSVLAALPVKHAVKYIIVVDEDIDIFDEKEVWWAIATRTQWDKDVRIIPGMKGVALDPSSVDGVSAKAIIDATRPAPPATFPERLDIPEKALKKAEKILAGI